MHYGEALEDERLTALLRPGEGIDTVITADVYGTGEADVALGRALAGVERDGYCLVGAIGHDFYTGERDGPRGFPRFTDPRLRDPDGYGQYIRMATERSLERCGVEHFDLLLLHNPDRVGYSSPAVWEGMEAVREAGLTRLLGVAPGPANGFTLDLIDCLERFGAQIDWAMIILGPLEPWPGELVLAAAQAHDVSLITRVVDYGGLFHDDVLGEDDFAAHDHRKFRPDGWVGTGREKLERMRPYAERHNLTMLQLACAWNLSQPAVRCVAPTLIQESQADPAHPARPVEDKRAELAALPAGGRLLSAEEVRAIRAIGENTGSMTLKGASLEHEGDARADRWAVDEGLAAAAGRWGVDPGRDLLKRELSAALNCR
jgi:aryl-alcohol dehydrogenase-like predicted oxidoreductase